MLPPNWDFHQSRLSDPESGGNDLVQTFFERSFAINRLRQGPLAGHIDLLAARLATHGYSRVHSAVEYIDPLLPRSLTLPVAFAKHLRYAYQNEHRFCWFPPHPINKVLHCDVEIESLKEFSDLIVL
jgi:hypothetical protein